jgi:predicted DNA-binding transcriptional regulator AlpA
MDEMLYEKDELPAVTKLSARTIEEEIRQGRFYGPDEIEDVTGMTLDEIHHAIDAKMFPCSREVLDGVSGWLPCEIGDWESAKQHGRRWRPPVQKRHLERETELYRHFDSAG